MDTILRVAILLIPMLGIPILKVARKYPNWSRQPILEGISFTLLLFGSLVSFVFLFSLAFSTSENAVVLWKTLPEVLPVLGYFLVAILITFIPKLSAGADGFGCGYTVVILFLTDLLWNLGQLVKYLLTL